MKKLEEIYYFSFFIFLFILCLFIYKSYKPQIKESDIIIEVNKDTLSKNSEESVLTFYEENKDAIKKVAKLKMRRFLGKLHGYNKRK